MHNINEQLYMVKGNRTCESEYSISSVSQHTLTSLVKRVPSACGLDSLSTLAHI